MHEFENLCYGALAVQLGFLDLEGFISGVSEWLQDPEEPLGDCLLRRQQISTEQKAELDGFWQTFLLDCLIPLSAHPSLRGEDSTGARSGLAPTVDFGIQASGSLPYVALRPLARGGLGKVSVALDTELQREVALKEIVPRSDSSDQDRERFLAEAKITGGLEHPGIVPVYGLEYTAEGQPRYAMRLIRGTSLQTAIAAFFQSPSQLRNDNESFRRLAWALIDACNAVAYAHNRGVVHRDLKPHNIMLGKFGETLVVDWGLAKVVDSPGSESAMSELPMQDRRSDDSSRTSAGSVLGTPAFMSPEQAEGRLDLVTPASDVFGLGATLYAVLTGKPPFRGSTPEDTLAAARAAAFVEPRTVNPGAPAPLAAVCRKAMAKDPRHRYATPSLLAKDLERWIAGDSVSAMREPLLQQLLRIARKYQSWVAASIGVALVAFCASLYANWAIGRQRDIARRERDTALEMRVKAETERRNSDRLRKVASTQAERAERNSRAAMEIVDRFVKELADTKWSEFPKFDAERLRMVDLAVQKCSDLLADDPDNSRLKMQCVQLLVRSSNLHRIMGEQEVAQERISRAFELIQDFKFRQADESAAGALSDSLNAAVLNAQLVKGPLAALGISQQELALARKRREAAPNSLNAEIALARAHLVQSELNLDLGKPRNAIRHAKAADALFETLVEKLEHIFALQVLHCYAHTVMGHAYRREGEFAKSRASLERALEIGHRALENFPDNNNVQDFLQGALFVLGKLELDTDRIPEGRARLQESLRVWERLAESHPDIEGYVRQQVAVLIALAESDYRGKDFKRAVKHATDALDRLQPLLESNRSTPVPHRALRLHARAVLLLSTDGDSDVDPHDFSTDLEVLQKAFGSYPCDGNELIQEAIGRTRSGVSQKAR